MHEKPLACSQVKKLEVERAGPDKIELFSVCLWAAAETCAEEVVHRFSKGRSDSRDKGCGFEAVLFLFLCSAEEAMPFEDGPVVVFQFNTLTSEAFNDTVQSRVLEERC